MVFCRDTSIDAGAPFAVIDTQVMLWISFQLSVSQFASLHVLVGILCFKVDHLLAQLSCFKSRNLLYTSSFANFLAKRTVDCWSHCWQCGKVYGSVPS